MADPELHVNKEEEDVWEKRNEHGDDDDDDDDDGEDATSTALYERPTVFPGNPMPAEHSEFPAVPWPSHKPWTYPPGGPETWATVVSTQSQSSQATTPQPEQESPTEPPTLITSHEGDHYPTPTSDSDLGYNGPPPSTKDKLEGKSAVFAAAGVVPVIVFAVVAIFLFFCLRKRKRQRKQEEATAAAAMQEMKTRTQPMVAAHYTNPPPPPPSAQPQYGFAPSHAPYAPPIPSSLPPVILGPIAPSSNGAYFTGIDTSDVVSVNERTGLGDPFADSNSLRDEPPPPYRPRSIQALSRDSSLRAPPAAAHSRTNLMESHFQDRRSPFADPQDDDAVSVISATRRQQDSVSVVSDLSYQNEPATARSSV